jgi:hypothetical protein
MNATRPAHAAYVRHIETCEATAHGRWCPECERLVGDADAEHWRIEAAKAAGRRIERAA